MSDTYTVTKGDNLSRIAANNGVTLGELLAANPQFTAGGRDPNLIYPGETVAIPPKKFAGQEASVCSPCKEPTKPALVDDGAALLNGSDAYKDCPDAVKADISSKTFTDDEKKEIEEVLGKYEKLLKCKDHPLHKIGRTDKAITKNGTCVSETDTMGEWFADQNALILTDNADTDIDFKEPGKQFRGTVAHELSHALMNDYDPRDCKAYDNAQKNPLMKEYKKAAGWDPTGTTLTETADDKAPTEYGKTNVEEDMAESAMLYLYEPETLKDRSPKRYEFMKELFGGE